MLSNLNLLVPVTQVPAMRASMVSNATSLELEVLFRIEQVGLGWTEHSKSWTGLDWVGLVGLVPYTKFQILHS